MGERQLVFIAVAVAQSAPILVLDEPTAHLDIRHQVEVMELLVDLNERDGTILAVLHDLALAAHFFPASSSWTAGDRRRRAAGRDARREQDPHGLRGRSGTGPPARRGRLTMDTMRDADRPTHPPAGLGGGHRPPGAAASASGRSSARWEPCRWPSSADRSVSPCSARSRPSRPVTDHHRGSPPRRSGRHRRRGHGP